MATEDNSVQSEDAVSNSGLDPQSYTAQRLVSAKYLLSAKTVTNSLKQHAAPEHLHLTSRCW